MTEFVGSRLTHGSFHQMNIELHALMAEKETILKIETLGPDYESAIAKLGSLINRVAGYAETPELHRADVNRDALFNSLYYAIYYLRHLDPSHTLAPQVQVLLPIMAAYKGIPGHELTKQTSEIDGLIGQLSPTAPMAAIKALGLINLMGALDTENNRVRTLTAGRTSTAATRTADTPQMSTDEARQQVVALYRKIVARVNAVAQLESTAEVEAFIAQANAVADHYTTVMANQAKTQAKKE